MLWEDSQVRSDGWRGWLFGFGVGVVTGFAAALGGALLLLLAVVVLALGFMARGSYAFLSGGFIGLGGLWVALTLRAQLACQSPSDPAVTCVATDVGPFLAVSAGVALVGVLIALAAWRRAAPGR